MDRIRIRLNDLGGQDRLLFQTLRRYAHTDRTGLATLFIKSAGSGEVTLKLLREIVQKADTRTPEGRTFRAYAERICALHDPMKYGDVQSCWWGDPAPLLRRFRLRGRYRRLRELDKPIILCDNN